MSALALCLSQGLSLGDRSQRAAESSVFAVLDLLGKLETTKFVPLPELSSGMRTPVLFGWCGSPKLTGVFYIVNPLYCSLCGRNIRFCESELRLLGSSEGGLDEI
jgi:hypothetical protein